MTKDTRRTAGAGPSHRSVELGVTLAIAVFALIVIAGSVQAGVGWGAEGPKAGFFPFYVGLVILGSSMDSGKPTLVNAVIDPAAGSESGNIGKLNPQSAIGKK